MANDRPITFVVAGQRRDAMRSAGSTPAEPLIGGQLKASVQIATSRGSTTERITAVPGQDVVVLHVANGPELYLHPEVARDLLLAQAGATDRSRARSRIGNETDVEVPAALSWPVAGPDAAVGRGLGDLLLSAFDVVSGLFADKADDFIASTVVKNVDGQVTEGVYALDRNALTPLKNSGRLRASIPAASDGGPILVLIHGTFSDTAGTFGKLWNLHRDRVGQLFDNYGQRVYALDHATLSESPIHNALQLAKACPEGARLHLLTHSRGGLVAEVLARACSSLALNDAPFEEDAYADQRKELAQLAALVRAKKLKVERVMRVACPARGTLLASTRLDAYLSVLKWALELAQIPVAPALAKLLGQVALQRTDPKVMPGLAAMMPDSPLVQWLHATEDAIEGDLRVLSGDVRGTSIMGWLKILISDWFYWTDSDLIVQTRSMYGGSPRATGARFVLDAGGDVSHFNYFKNERSVGAIVDGLLQDEPRTYRPIGPLSWAGEDASGLRAARQAHAQTKPPAELPALFVLPGILGSNLKVYDKRIWLSLRIVGGLHRLAYDSDGVLPDGPIGSIYDELMEHLAETHEVIPFAFDWRRPLEEEALRLAEAVDTALAARSVSGQPVRMLAHSMGGLLARTMWLEQPETWKRMLAHAGARLLMLGTPNDGSWSPMQVLSGDDDFGSLLSSVGAPFHEHDSRQLMAAMPGFLQLQAGLLDPELKLDKAQTWKKLADADFDYYCAQTRWHASALQQDAHRWGLPSQDVLDRATALRKRLNQQLQQLSDYASKLLLVVGRADKTPAGFATEPRGFEYEDETQSGDGRVTLASARLPGVRTWTLDSTHGDLPRVRSAFAAFGELLERGETQRLSALPASLAAARSGGHAGAELMRTRSRPARTRLHQPPTPAVRPSDVLAPSSETEQLTEDARVPALRVTVQNGDLTLIPQPLLVGHYRSFTLTGAEYVVNKLIGGTMERSLNAGQYPDLPGQNQIFSNLTTDAENPWRAACPEAVVVVGLGEETMLNGGDLARSVRNGVIAWSQRLYEQRRPKVPARISLATTLIGSGGSGISAGMSARQVAQGVFDANRQLAAMRWPIVANLVLIELFHDRASAAWQELNLLATSNLGQFEIDPLIKPGNGALPRPIDADYRGIDNDLITVTTGGDKVHSTISFTVDTRRARSEVTAQKTQTNLLQTLVASASNERTQNATVGRTLFQLLVPPELEPFLSSRSRMVLELDPSIAGIPWELLDVRRDAASSDEPWAIRTHLLRKLRTSDHRRGVSDAREEDHILIIGEPQCDATKYPGLPSAAQEAQHVQSQLAGIGKSLALSDKLHLLLNADARSIIDTLFERRYRIVHIAGHGEPGPDAGVVLSDGIFLGPNEIRAMRTVPELVFVNCCYLGQVDREALLAPYDRSKFAAGVAEELIKIGVRCVVAAGWAVDDGVAKLFASVFYRELLMNRPFIEAVNEARKAAWNNGRNGNTWAAYQCYGDPDWTLRRSEGAPVPTRSVQDEFSRIASAQSLLLALKTLEVQTQFQHWPQDVQRERLDYLDAKFGDCWGDAGDVAEAFARAHAAMGCIPRALVWYERALRDEAGRASLHAEDQLHNLRARNAEKRIQQLRRGDVNASARQAMQKELQIIDEAAAALERLCAIQLTQERASLCGAAYKRKAMAVAGEGDAGAAAAESHAKILSWYERARDFAYARQGEDAFYPALNCLAIELISHAGDAQWRFDEPELERVARSLEAKIQARPDFWSKVGEIELKLYKRLADGTLGGFDEIESDFQDLHLRVEATWMWRSVFDQARFVLLSLERVLSPGDPRLKALDDLCRQLAEYASAEPWLSEVSNALPARPRQTG